MAPKSKRWALYLKNLGSYMIFVNKVKAKSQFYQIFKSQNVIQFLKFWPKSLHVSFLSVEVQLLSSNLVSYTTPHWLPQKWRRPQIWRCKMPQYMKTTLNGNITPKMKMTLKMSRTPKIKVTQKIKTTLEWKRTQKWKWLQNWKQPQTVRRTQNLGQPQKLRLP